MKKSNIFLSIIIGMGVIATVFIAYVDFRTLFPARMTLDEYVEMSARDINKKAPMMIDPFIRLDSATAKRSILYCKYTYIGEHTSRLDPVEIQSTLTPIIVSNIRSGSLLKELGDANMTFHIDVHDKYGTYITTIRVNTKQI